MTKHKCIDTARVKLMSSRKKKILSFNITFTVQWKQTALEYVTKPLSLIEYLGLQLQKEKQTCKRYRLSNNRSKLLLTLCARKNLPQTRSTFSQLNTYIMKINSFYFLNLNLTLH